MGNIIQSIVLLNTIVINIIMLSTIILGIVMLTNNNSTWLSTWGSIYINGNFMFYINIRYNILKYHISHFYLLYGLFMHLIFTKNNIATSNHYFKPQYMCHDPIGDIQTAH